MKIAKFLVVLAVALGSWPSVAKADDWGSLGLAYMFGYNSFNQPQLATYNASVPYFSLHPPVYYGQRYMRPYGASPFASWPQLNTHPGYAPRPARSTVTVIDNPYAKGMSSRPGAQGIVTIEPAKSTIIDNPYADADVKYTAKNP